MGQTVLFKIKFFCFSSRAWLLFSKMSTFTIANHASAVRSPAVAGPLSARKVFSGVPLAKSVQTARRSRQVAAHATRPTGSGTDTVDVDNLVKDLQDKWDRVENKTSVAVYAGGAVVALWLSSTIVGAVNAVPLLPKLLELVGLGYTSWFVYRYLLFKSSREELLEDIEGLKGKISGATEDISGEKPPKIPKN